MSHHCHTNKGRKYITIPRVNDFAQGRRHVPRGRAVSKERLGDWDGQRMSEPPCGVPHGETESGSIVLAVICWATSAQEEGGDSAKREFIIRSYSKPKQGTGGGAHCNRDRGGSGAKSSEGGGQ